MWDRKQNSKKTHKYLLEQTLSELETSFKHADAVRSILADASICSAGMIETVWADKALSEDSSQHPKHNLQNKQGVLQSILKRQLVDHKKRDRWYFKLCSITMKILFCIMNLQPAKCKMGWKGVWTCNFTTTAIISLYYRSSVVLLQHKRHIRQSDTLLIPFHLQGD